MEAATTFKALHTKQDLATISEEANKSAAIALYESMELCILPLYSQDIRTAAQQLSHR